MTRPGAAIGAGLVAAGEPPAAPPGEPRGEPPAEPLAEPPAGQVADPAGEPAAPDPTAEPDQDRAPAPAPNLDAEPGQDQAPDAPPTQFVVFAVGPTAFALPGAQVAEVLPLATIYPVPGCPPAAEGVIDVRGRICSVLRVGDLLDCPHGAVTRHGAILLGVAAGIESGLRVDAVLDVLDLPAAALHPVPEPVPGRLAGLVTGLFDWRARPVLALDLERLFTAWLDGRL